MILYNKYAVCKVAFAYILGGIESFDIRGQRSESLIRNLWRFVSVFLPFGIGVCTKGLTLEPAENTVVSEGKLLVDM